MMHMSSQTVSSPKSFFRRVECCLKAGVSKPSCSQRPDLESAAVSKPEKEMSKKKLGTEIKVSIFKTLKWFNNSNFILKFSVKL